MMARCSTLRTVVVALAATFIVAGYSYDTVQAQAQNAPPPAAKSAATPGASPVPDEKASAKRTTDCEHFAAVLSGRKASSALLDTAEVKALARQVPDLVACGSVVQDSDELCRKLFKGETTDGTQSGFVPEGPYRACREGWSDFHELRTQPAGRSFMFNDINLQQCKSVKEMEPLCDKIRAAMRAGDEGKCTSVGPMESICRAQIKLDKSLCQAPKGNAFFDKNGADLAKDCTDKIEKKGIFAKGLKSVAESGPPRERELAKAALKQPDACEPFVKRAVELCTASTGAPAPAGSAPAKSTGSTPAAAKK